MNKLKQLDKQVRSVLSGIPETRNSDIELHYEILKAFYPNSIKHSNGERLIRVNKLYEAPRESHVCRIRRKIQNDEKMYLPTDVSVFLARAKNSKMWRKELGYQDWWDDYHWKTKAESYIKEKDNQISLF